MVYQNQYALAIIQDGKIVPESNGGVTLPYGSEYKIRLKNESRQKSIADIYIDGAIAVKGIIVDEDGTVDVERYIRPGVDLFSSGARFKLARLGNPGVADAGDDQNGLIDVRFYKEKQKLPQPVVTHITTWPQQIVNTWHPPYNVTCQQGQTPMDPGVFQSTCDFLATHGGNKIGKTHDGSAACDGVMYEKERSKVLSTSPIRSGIHTKSARTADGPAATVKGSQSSQRVENVYMEVATDKFDTLSLKLFGVTKITRIDVCPCGHKRRNTEWFCPKCGTKLVEGE